MGNNNSKTTANGSAPPSANASPNPTFAIDAAASTRRAPRRRDSAQGLPTPKTSVAIPTASLESATGESASQSRVSASHSRGRSQTVATPGAKSPLTNKEMGQRQSVEKAAGSGLSGAPSRSSSPHYRKSAPLPTPISTDISSDRYNNTDGGDVSPIPTPYSLPPSQFIRPPRLPLPIQEELLSPGSPIISPTDLTDLEDGIPRKSSMISSTTADEDEMAEDMFSATDMPTGMPATETMIEWKQGGKKVYVTGTFANWNKKFKLHEHGPSKDPKALSAYIPLPPGTHHVTFLVDGQMRTANHMPTAVDWTNALVNYIEVSAPESKAKEPSPPASAGKTAAGRTSIGGTQALPPTPELRPSTGAPASHTTPTQTATSSKKPPTPPTPVPTKKQSTEKKYHPSIPRFLLDLDAPEESSRYLRASAVMGTQPAPPSLPMFLSKSILNGATPMKDDSSVLVLPNHTVLNHLATSSIKNGVLATSATTRYKKKYVTTILYKPTSEGEVNE